MSTFGGTGGTAYAGEGVPVTSARFSYPVGIWIDGTAGDIYLGDSGLVRFHLVLASTNTVNTFAGTGTSGNTGNGGAATSATFAEPQVVSQDTNGNFYLLDNNNANVRVVYSIQPTPAPTVVPTRVPTVAPSIAPTVLPSFIPTLVPSVLPTVAPSASPSMAPSVSICPTQAPSVAPTTSTTAGPTSARASSNSIDTFAGTGNLNDNGSGSPATEAALNNPRGVWGDSLGVIYISETSGNCVRKVDTATNIIQVFAGECGSAGSSGDDGPASSAALNGQVGLFVASTGVVYIADYGNSKIRSVSYSSNIIRLVAGIQSASDNSGDGGAPTAAGVYGPSGVWADTLGEVYISSFLGNVIRSISTSNIITTIAGKRFYFCDDISDNTIS